MEGQSYKMHKCFVGLVIVEKATIIKEINADTHGFPYAVRKSRKQCLNSGIVSETEKNMSDLKSKLKKLNWYYYRQKDGCGDRPICQYMRLDYLIRLLETKEYYVKRREHFEDANEGYSNRQIAFGFNAVGANSKPQPKYEERLVPYKDIVSCPTSCWSMCEHESFLMWKCYATEIGACIRTSVHNFIASLEIDLDKTGMINKVLCGSMDYKENLIHSTDEEQQLFEKDCVYADEKEFRFYFLLNADLSKESKAVYIPVNTEVMITEVQLSPFINREAARKIARMMKCSYNIDVKQSKIKFKL